ncbi:MAG TPA: hypothetical protein VJ742_11950 [Nitrososphaera sp.]|nr:hypothetical protein [Nitrososphaera sp.]
MTNGTNLPKYIQQANEIIDLVANEPQKTWAKTQKEMAQQLNVPQPVLSNLLKLLEQQGKIRRGKALPTRGRNFTIELVDDTHLTCAVSKENSGTRRPDDRVRAKGEQIEGVVNLGDFNPDKIGAAVFATIRNLVEREEKLFQAKRENAETIRTMKAALEDERRNRFRLEERLQRVSRELEEAELEKRTLRGKINDLLIRNGNKPGVPIKETLDEESLNTLEYLLKESPGRYKKSDQEVGLSA